MKKVVKSNKGQGVLEYVILTSLIGMISLIAIKNFGAVLDKRINNMKKQITKNISLK